MLPGKSSSTAGVPLTGNEAASCPSLPSPWTTSPICHLHYCLGYYMGRRLLPSRPSCSAWNQDNRGGQSVNKGESIMQRQLLGFNPWWHSLFPSCSVDGFSHHGLGDGEIAYATTAWDASDRSNPYSSIPSSDQVLRSRIFPTSMWLEGSILSGMLQLVPQPW